MPTDQGLEAVVWHDREQGGRELARALGAWKGRRPLILAIPRGAVPMGAIVADALGGDLDVMLVHKVGHPIEPEVAIGAVDEHGHVLARDRGAVHESLTIGAQRELAHLRARRSLYGGPPAEVRGRSVILVDDGIATGSTMLAAVRAARAGGAKEVVVASPVAAPHAVALLKQEADAVIVLAAPPGFYAVGQFYRDFRQVEDDEVRALLAARRAVPVA